MKKLLLALSLMSGAAMSNAVDVVASYDGDAYVGGVNVMSTTGYVNIEWNGYETPYQGRTAWRVVVWDTQVSNYPIANEIFLASSVPSYYTRNYAVSPGHPIRVELYAAANQSWNSPILSHNVATYMWVSPLDIWRQPVAYTAPPPVLYSPSAYTLQYPLVQNTVTVWQ